MICAATLFAGCVTNRPAHDAMPMRQAVASGATIRPPQSTPKGERESSGAVLATVDGRPIFRDRVVRLLLRGHGVDILEQLVVLSAAEAALVEKGLSVTDSHVRAEYDRALRRLVDPLPDITPASFDRALAERLLSGVLSDRGISNGEFRLAMRRNACLRLLAAERVEITEQALRAEFDRRYGPRVQVRHIQLSTPRQVALVRRELAAGGDFAQLARLHSANTASAAEGGLLDPFSALDDRVPPPLREAAFALPPDQVSAPVSVGEWIHLLLLERKLPAEPVRMEDVRGELEHGVRDRLTEIGMAGVYESLFREAVVEVRDPILHELFQAKYEKKAPER